MTTLWYFGCRRTHGHYFYIEDTDHWDNKTLRPEGVPDEIISQIDGGFCPPNIKQEQGPARITHLAGWTLLGFWDRSIDGRFGSNSAFLAEGDFNFEEMVNLAQERFPTVWARLPFAVTEWEEHERNHYPAG